MALNEQVYIYIVKKNFFLGKIPKILNIYITLAFNC